MSRNRKAGEARTGALSRRSVLLGSTALAQAPVVTVLSAHLRADDQRDNAAREEPRYRETGHIRAFYSRSRF